MTSGQEITTPHEHDVLSGRGNFVNYHAGNEHFRALVRKHKLEYVQCPKPQKGKFSRLIVDEIKSRNPPGRFLKQDASTKLWYDIGDKKALDKTRQALREGAPDIMKMTGESGDDDDSDDGTRGKVVQKDALNAMGSSRFPGDGLNHPFLAGGMQSPVMQRNQFAMASPHVVPSQMMSPGMMMSPEMQKMPLVNTQSMPAPQVHQQQQFDQAAMNQLTQQQQHMMMNAGMGNNFAVGGRGGGMNNQMMNQQLAQMNQQLNQQLNHLNQQVSGKSQNQNNFSGQMQSLNRLQAVYSNDQFEPRPLGGQMPPRRTPPPPPPDENATPRLRNKVSGNSSYQLPQNRVESLPGNNPRRMPPPSLLKRENSLKMEKVFSATSPAAAKKPSAGNNSSAHLSAMSLSLGDMQEGADLSDVFDSSLRISTSHSKEKVKQERSSSIFEGPSLDMSVATIGHSENGNMSFATFGESNTLPESEHMSFSHVFEESEKLSHVFEEREKLV